MRLTKLGSIAAASAIAVGASFTASAADAAILGIGSIEGVVQFSANAFDFVDNLPNGGTDPSTPSPNVSGLATGSLGFFSGSSVSVTDLCTDDFIPFCPVVSLAEAPIDNFLEWDGNTFDLETIAGPTITDNSVGGFSIFEVAFQVTGTFEEAGTGALTSGAGSFTTQIVGTDLPAFLAAADPTAFIESTFSATLIAVPEPATTAGLVAAGLMGVAARARKKKSDETDASTTEA